MSTRDQVNAIRVVKVNKHGKEPAFSSLGDKLQRLNPEGFVAIDTEFSGLGSHPDLKHENLQTRYAALRSLADTRAIFSVGISIFDRVIPDATMTDPAEAPPDLSAHGTRNYEHPVTYQVATYDVLMSCQSDFSVNSDSGTFLVAHAFDFNQMFKNGIPYQRASTEKPPEKRPDAKIPWQWGKLPRGLLWRIGRRAVPLIVHNGLFDLVFLYAAFQGPLPDTLDGFISALLECVPAGFWDSKVLASSVQERASYLGYLFAKSVLGGIVHVRNCTGLPSEDITNPKGVSLGDARDTLCALFSFRGFCPRGVECPFSHDPFMVVQEEKEGNFPKDNKEAYKRHKIQSKNLKKRAAVKSDISKLSKKQRKRLLEARAAGANGAPLPNRQEIDAKASVAEADDAAPSKGESQVHTAGWDAFCTGYVFAAYRDSMSTEKMNKEHNRIALPYKLSSLLLCKSQFANLDAPDSRKPAELSEAKEPLLTNSSESN